MNKINWPNFKLTNMINLPKEPREGTNRVVGFS